MGDGAQSPSGGAGDQPGRDAIEVLVSEHASLQELFRRVSGPDEDRRAVLKELMQTLANHLAVEKAVLVPALSDRVTDGEQLASALTDEHKRAEHILTLLERRKTNSPDVPELVTELLDITDEHVRRADTAVIPGLRAALTPAELVDMGETMVSDERSLLTHSHPALPDSGPVAAVTRRLAEVVDGIRDRSSDVGRTTS
jgi:hypothetical protein